MTIPQLHEICESYLGQADIAERWMPTLAGAPLLLDTEVCGYVSATGLEAGSPAELRAGLLARAEKLIEALAEAGWILDSAPSIEFSGRLQRARYSLGSSRPIMPPQECGIGLRIRLGVHKAEWKGTRKEGVVTDQCCGRCSHSIHSHSTDGECSYCMWVGQGGCHRESAPPVERGDSRI